MQEPWEPEGERLGLSMQIPSVHDAVQIHRHWFMDGIVYKSNTWTPNSLTCPRTQPFPFSRRKKGRVSGLWLENRGWRWWRRLNEEPSVCTLLALISSSLWSSLQGFERLLLFIHMRLCTPGQLCSYTPVHICNFHRQPWWISVRPHVPPFMLFLSLKYL